MHIRGLKCCPAFIQNHKTARNSEAQVVHILFGNSVSLVKRHSHLINGFFQLGFLRILQLGLGLVGTYFITHSLTVEQYGEYQSVLNIIGILTIFSLTEFSNTLMQSIARGHNGSFLKMIRYPFLASFIGSLILVGFSVWYGLQGHNSLMICYLVAAAAFPFINGLTLWRGIKLGRQQFSSLTAIEVTSLICLQVGIIALTFLFPGEYVEIFLWFSFVPLVINIYLVYKFWKEFRHYNSPAEDGVISHALHASFYNSFYTVANYFDRVLVGFFLGPVTLAIFIAADRIPDLLRSVVQDAATVLAPKFANTEHYTRKLDVIFKLFCIAFLIAAFIFGLLLLPYVITLIYGDKYSESIFYSQLLIVAYAIGNLSSLQFRYIRSKLDTKNYRNITISTSIIRVLVSLMLVPWFGIVGAVASALIYRTALSVITNYIVHKEYGLDRSIMDAAR